jgi:hypothetical protein
MFSLSATTSLRVRRLISLIVAALSITALLATAAPAARTPTTETDSSLAQYGWGAAATFAKQQTRTVIATSAHNDLLAQYGWGAAATFAKQHA